VSILKLGLVLTNSSLKNFVKLCFINKLRMLAFNTFKLHSYFFTCCNICAKINVYEGEKKRQERKKKKDGEKVGSRVLVSL
jgi:hypothetical protein